MRVPLVTMTNTTSRSLFFMGSAPRALDSRRLVFTRSVGVKSVLEEDDTTRQTGVNQPVGQGVVLRTGIPVRGRPSSWSVRALGYQCMFWSGSSGRRGLLHNVPRRGTNNINPTESQAKNGKACERERGHEQVCFLLLLFLPGSKKSAVSPLIAAVFPLPSLRTLTKW